MLKYAREDTHYLLYIYDVMLNELLEKGLTLRNKTSLVQTVLKKSTELCLTVYSKPLVKDMNYYLVIGRNKTLSS